jgi:hypothetical protein
MAGKKGRSGPPGNLNGCSYAWRSFWKRKAVKPTHRWVLPFVDRYAETLASEKPGLTEAEHRVLEIAQISRGCSMLILAECASVGLIRRIGDTWDLSPGAKELGKYLSVELKALTVLGLERRVKPIGGTLAELLSVAEGRDDQ